MNAPHIRKKQNTPQIYLDVVIALLPCCVAAVYMYGVRAAVLLLWAALLHAFLDWIFAQYVRREQAYIDLSGLTSGLILVLLLPPTVSIWVVSAGVLFSSVVVKQFFGGAGNNLFNPAFAARAFLAVAFSDKTSVIAEPFQSRFYLESLISGPSGLLSAAPGHAGWLQLMTGFFPGAMGLTGAVFAVAGGVYLAARGVLKLQTPIAYAVTLISGYWMFFFGTADLKGMIGFLAGSGVVFCAVFALGDFSTVPTSGSGRIAFGIGTGVLTLALFSIGQSVMAIISSVLLMNAVTPILEFYIRPRVFAHKHWFSRKGKNDSERFEEGGTRA